MAEEILEISEIETTREIDLGTYKHNCKYEGYRIVTAEQEIVLIIDAEQDCCEVWGYFFCNEDPKEFIGAMLHELKVTDTGLETDILLENGIKPDSFEWGGAAMFVNLETDRGTLQFVAYNKQNGYYGHRVRIESKDLNHEEVL